MLAGKAGNAAIDVFIIHATHAVIPAKATHAVIPAVSIPHLL